MHIIGKRRTLYNGLTMAVIITTWLVKSCSLKLLHHQALVHLAKLYTKIKGFSTAELEIPLSSYFMCVHCAVQLASTICLSGSLDIYKYNLICCKHFLV